eukprot:4450628-Pleurochrysis_carterae.AAC.2
MAKRGSVDRPLGPVLGPGHLARVSNERSGPTIHVGMVSLVVQRRSSGAKTALAALTATRIVTSTQPVLK